MKIKSMKKTLLGFAILYIVIFAARVSYEFTAGAGSQAPGVNYPAANTAANEMRSVTNNYASLKMEYSVDGAGMSVLDQKYERIASIVARSVNYDSDMAAFGAALDEHRAVVQMENRSGLSGSRRAVFTIGVRPESFDAMGGAVSKIGRLVSSTTTKTDKTYEYRQALAEKETLERRRSGYEGLRSNGGSIPDLLQLEEKIIEVEAQIQQQMILLGEFSDENALCTINYTIYEGREQGSLVKIWNALGWTTAVYAIIAAVVLLTALAAFLAVWCWSKIRKILNDNTRL